MRRFDRRVSSALILAALVMIGLATKLYRGKFETWFHNYAGAIVYEVFWIVLFGAVLPRAKPWRIGLSVFAVTCGLEFLQLYHPAFLEAIRSNFFGRALIGTGFDRLDFIYYVVGSAIGWGICRAMSPRRETAHGAPSSSS